MVRVDFAGELFFIAMRNSKSVAVSVRLILIPEDILSPTSRENSVFPRKFF